MKDNKIKRRTFLKTCGVVFSGIGIPGQNLVIANEQNSFSSIEPSQIPELPCVHKKVDYVVVGGGVAGVCSAITAARSGLKVVLIQDRPVLGGNASSEVRLWILGATSHMNNNNRWAREGGVLDEIIVENMYRNKEGNSIFFDALLLEKVWNEPNITLLLNTSVYEVEMEQINKIKSVKGFCSQNSTLYKLEASFFCDASGDGIIGFLSGAKFRIGAEKSDVYGEKFIFPQDYGELLGHSMYFYSKEVDHPVKFVAPSFALKDIETKIPRFKDIQRDSSGCRLWWLEWGDDLDHVFESETIKNELWKVVYGVWDYIKNSGNFENVDNLTLEWISTIPGKRESRRFEGDYTIIQQDIVLQQNFEDAIAYGGWAIDLHPAAGVYSKYSGNSAFHSKGVYQIPYRAIYSKNIVNLFLGGRLISSSHIAFGSTRVIATGTLCAQAAAKAAEICIKRQILPKEIIAKGFIKELQQNLLQIGQYIPKVEFNSKEDLIQSAKLEFDGRLILSELPSDGTWRELNKDIAMLLPLRKGRVPKFVYKINSQNETRLDLEICTCSRKGSYTPDVSLAQKSYIVKQGKCNLTVNFGVTLDENKYVFVIVKKNKFVSIAQSDVRLSGVLSLFHIGTQKSNSKLGIEEIPIYTPERRPNGKNLAIKIVPGIDNFGEDQLRTGFFRPANENVNAWIAPLQSSSSTLRCFWEKEQKISRIILRFDSDFDHPMESCLMGHPEDIMPFCVQHFLIRDSNKNIIYECISNHQSYNNIVLANSIMTNSIYIEFKQTKKNVPISLFGIQVFS